MKRAPLGTPIGVLILAVGHLGLCLASTELTVSDGLVAHCWKYPSSGAARILREMSFELAWNTLKDYLEERFQESAFMDGKKFLAPPYHGDSKEQIQFSCVGLSLNHF